MSDCVDPYLLLACCRNYGFVALDEYDVVPDTYRLTWIDDALVKRCATGPLAVVVSQMAASLHMGRLPDGSHAPDAPTTLASLDARYLADPVFHALVDSLASLALTMRLQPSDLLAAWALVQQTRAPRSHSQAPD